VGPYAPPAPAPGGRCRTSRQQEALAAFDPGSNARPKCYWSLTLGAQGTHCPRSWLDVMHRYMQHHDLRGAVALEKGGKNGIQHVQGVIEAAAAGTADGKETFNAHIKRFAGWDVLQQPVKMTPPHGNVHLLSWCGSLCALAQFCPRANVSLHCMSVSALAVCRQCS
jgi:hypothetical protein